MPAAMDTATPADRPSANPTGERWVTLRELAELRGISQHSAARLVRRHRWRRQTDNQGHVRALVPVETLGRPTDKPTATDSPAAGPVAALVDLLRQQIENATGRADRTEAALTTERVRSDALRDQLAAAEQSAEQARAKADAAVQAAEALRDQVARAVEDRDQLRGMIDGLERRAAAAAADRRAAEGRAEEATSHADALKGLLEATQLELAEQRVLTDQADAARQHAEDAANTLRQTDEARKARGRWRAAWAAWRMQP
jgi:hypothetical protein